MTKSLYLLSASLAIFVGTAFAQAPVSSAGAFPIHGSGSSGFATSMPMVDPMVAPTTSPVLPTPAATVPVVIPSVVSKPTTVAVSVATPAMSKSTPIASMSTLIVSMSTPIIIKPTTLMSAPTMMTKPTTMPTAAAPLAPAVTHAVTVGGLNNEFVPNFVNAKIGDTIIFTFLEDNHTLTESTFNTPCMKSPAGFDSGFIPNLNRAANPAPTVKMQVTTTMPLFYYCKQEDHCVADGMVFVINPTTNMSVAAFIAKAKSFGTTATSTMATMMKPTATALVSTMAPTPSIVAGTGTIVNGQCTCACLCGTNAFPAMAGIGAFGGLSGMAPQSALAAVAAMGTPT